MQNKLTAKPWLLVVGLFLILTFQVTLSYAQEQTHSASSARPTASPTPSDTEIKKTLVRSLDKIEEQQKASDAKDKVISEQDKGLAESEAAKEAYKKAASSYKDAYEKQQQATLTAEEAWKLEQKRVRDLEKKVRKSDSRVKWMAVGAVTAIVATIVLKR